MIYNGEMIKDLRKWISPAAIAALAFTAFQARGDEVTWVGGDVSGPNNWNNSKNWSPSTEPSPSHTVVFAGSATYQPKVNTKAAAQGVIFRSAGWTVEDSSDSFVLNVSSGGIHSATTGTNTVKANISIGSASTQTWEVDSGGTLVIDKRIADGTSLTKAGSGTMTLGTSGSFIKGTLIVSEGTLRVNGSVSGTGGVVVQSGATLEGSGTVSKISGAGTVGPGNSPGILTTGSVDGSLGTDFTFEFTQAAVSGMSTPIFSNAAASGNDVLRITDDTPFTTALNANNVVTVDFTGLTLALGDVYQGGFYSDKSDFLSSISSATFNYLGVDEGLQIHLSTIEASGDFSGGTVNGYITQFTVIPEPTATALIALSMGGLWFIARRMRREKALG